MKGLILLFTVILMCGLTFGCGVPTSPAPSVKSQVTLKGTYTAILLGIEQTLTFDADTITRFDPLEGKKIFKYYFTDEPLVPLDPFSPIVVGFHYQPPPPTKVSPDKAVTIWMQDITVEEWLPSTFEYIPDHDVIVLNDISYFK